MDEKIFPYEKKCAKCGKNFVAAPYHRFKENSKWYCSWTCYNHRNDGEGADNDGSCKNTRGTRR